MIIEVEATPLADVTKEALDILFRGLGTVNTTRFLNQFTVGYGNYIEEREVLFGHLTLNDIVTDIKQSKIAKK